MSRSRRDGPVDSAWPSLRWTAALAASFVGTVLVCLPVLPVSTAQALRHINPWLASTYGWPQFTEQVAAAAAPFPSAVPIFTGYYTEAGALTILGRLSAFGTRFTAHITTTPCGVHRRAARTA